MPTIKRRDRTPSFRGYTVMMIGAAVPMASPFVDEAKETESGFKKGRETWRSEQRHSIALTTSM